MTKLEGVLVILNEFNKNNVEKAQFNKAHKEEAMLHG
jgi:hypothetical protein